MRYLAGPTIRIRRAMRRFLLIFVAAVSLLFAVGCSFDRDQSAAQSSGSDTLRPDSDMMGATIFMYDRQYVTAEIRAERIRKFESVDSTMGYVLDINMFDTTGKLVSSLISDSGLIRESTEDLHAYGHVVVITEDSSKLETDSLYFDPATNLIHTDEFVKITRGADTLTGWGLEADRQLRGLKILRGVSGSLDQKPEESEL